MASIKDPRKADKPETPRAHKPVAAVGKAKPRETTKPVPVLKPVFTDWAMF